jgi:hypothetical protein
MKSGMERTNEAWLSELRDGSSGQAAAIEDLRQFLQQGVLAYLHSRSDLKELAEAELRQMSVAQNSGQFGYFSREK